ncbi:Aste57867_11989 [Aphanomyces stellatus]|uniref:Aste57867_11989 protein n=1 Tax=Aphanomyces stellatus TaxID=120398 RepID=A0A485KUF3_9STRA|nr:hypothetical protein As57867_011944 [Aphanomyces stellatus]VFT88844.1 Aste57867_11989 [Aphanomyces stellatus]
MDKGASLVEISPVAADLDLRELKEVVTKITSSKTMYYLNPQATPIFHHIDAILKPIYTSSKVDQLRLLQSLSTGGNVRSMLLVHALFYGHNTVVDYLLRHFTYTTTSPLDLAGAYGRHDMFAFIKRVRPSMKATSNALDYAAGNGHLNMVWHLHSTGHT